MWFKQIKLFQLNEPINKLDLLSSLKKLKFRPCLPNLPVSMGWVSPTEDAAETIEITDEEDREIKEKDEIIQINLPLMHEANGYLMLCLQTEEKILPATVVRNKVKERIKEIQANENRKVSGKEKQALREDIYHGLIPQAFAKLSKTYAYIDIKNNQLILNTITEKKSELFISFLKKTLRNIEIKSLETKNISKTMTHWLQNNKCPQSLTIENCCVLQDPSKQGRIIRCQQQDLYAPSIQTLLKEGCEINQMQFTWNDQLTFTLKDDFTFRSLKYQDAVIELANEAATETKLERFNVDFLIMSETTNKLITELLDVFDKK
jgi:recombination associated protein RdgC